MAPIISLYFKETDASRKQTRLSVKKDALYSIYSVILPFKRF